MEEILGMAVAMVVSIGIYFIMERKQETNSSIEWILSSVEAIDICGSIKDYLFVLESLERAKKRLELLVIDNESLDERIKCKQAMVFVDININECNKRIIDSDEWYNEMVGI